VAPTLVATAGSGSANSYVTRANASTYLDARLNVTVWTAASDEDKDRALISATRALDGAPWIGFRASDTQALAWPRTYALKPDRPYDTGSDDIYFATTTVPQAVQDATCELALELLRAGDDRCAVQGHRGGRDEEEGRCHRNRVAAGPRPARARKVPERPRSNRAAHGVDGGLAHAAAGLTMAIQRSPLRRPTRAETRRRGVLVNTVLKAKGEASSEATESFDSAAFDVDAFDADAFDGVDV
jgi:hypothetical protein